MRGCRGFPGDSTWPIIQYDPYLAGWLQGPAGQRLAGLSVVLVHALNGVEAAAYRTSGFRVADVATAFSTNDFAHREQLPGVGSVPRNVHRICSWTYMCARNDIPANTAGYRQIALASTRCSGAEFIGSLLRRHRNVSHDVT